MSMSADAYAKFLRALGHRIVQTPSAQWYNANRFFFLSAPSHREYAPSDVEVRQVLRQCLGARYAAPLSASGKLSYQIVCDNRDYGLAGLSANLRSKVRRGLRRCEVGPISFSDLAVEGRQAHTDTLARQGRDGGMGEDRWDRFWRAADAAPGFEGWAARVDGRVAAFLVSVSFEDGVEFMLARSCSDDLGAYPNNALIYSVTEEMLVRRQVEKITFGLESLEPVGPLDQFKFGMGFEARPLRQRVVFHPLLAAFLRTPMSRVMVRRWTAHRDDTFWRKAAGLLRFAEEGGF